MHQNLCVRENPVGQNPYTWGKLLGSQVHWMSISSVCQLCFSLGRTFIKTSMVCSSISRIVLYEVSILDSHCPRLRKAEFPILLVVPKSCRLTFSLQHNLTWCHQRLRIHGRGYRLQPILRFTVSIPKSFHFHVIAFRYTCMWCTSPRLPLEQRIRCNFNIFFRVSAL